MPADHLFLKDVLSVSILDLDIMDIGAMIEGEDRYESLISQGLATVTGFEPNPANLEKLNARPGPYRYFPYFLGDGSPATFHRTRYPGCSSLLEPNGDVINLFTSIGAEDDRGNFTVMETTEVETIRLDDIEDLAMPDYVKIDVQGAELLVMENAQKTFADVLVLETEVEFVSIYKDQPLFCDIQKYLVGQGFMLHKMVDIAGRTLRPMRMKNPYQAMSQVLWADAVFVRDYTDLSVYSDQQLLKAAVILNDVYRSYDVVARLLGEYDKRQATALTAAYTTALSSLQTLDLLFMNLKEKT